MGASFPATPILAIVSTGLGMIGQMQQARYQERSYRQQEAYNQQVYEQQQAYRQQSEELERATRERRRQDLDRQYQVGQQTLAETTRRDRRRSLLEFQREERERLRRLRAASGTAAASAAARGVGGGGSAAAIQRGLESEIDTLSEQAERDRREFERQLGYDSRLSAYDLERERYVQAAGLSEQARRGALDYAYDRQSAAMSRAHQRRSNLLTLSEQRARARLGLLDSFSDLGGHINTLAGSF